MTHKEIAKALKDIRPNAEWTLSGDDFADLEWLDKESIKPTLAEIEAAIANPLPEPEPTVADKLAAAGINLDELKTALLLG
jgi:hypothetical protein